ncbi:cysteine-rich CWC family protein [Caldimonas thermodepolymerans]|jgi:hypothetical protein|uniref:cysteine-rich CWC family protein n=1 Tax=Caldimonas thermodepolymerans TaxID=215580 RepID=UPI00249344DF|nr:cysteine-rich CWC family protein [Caldimonas thermodepolymerans]
MTPPPAPPDPAACPLCGRPNACSMAPAAGCGTSACGDGGPCWCTTLSFPPELLARVPPEARGRACICRHCVEAWSRTASSG